MAGEHWRVISVALKADTGQYTTGMGRAARATKSVGDAVDKTGAQTRGFSERASDVGRQLTTKVSLPLVAAAGLATKMAVSFDTTFTQMQGLAGVAASEVDGLRASVMGLASETGRGPQELAAGLYQIRSSGLAGQAALDTLDRSARAAAVGLGSTEVIADAVTSAINAYGVENLSAAKATDVLVGAVREGKGEPEEMARQFGRLLPVASELGIEFEEVAGATAFLTRSSGDAAQSSTQLSGIMQKLLRPSRQGAKELASVGLSAQGLRDIVANQGLLPALQLLDERLGGNSERLGKVFEDSEALTGALALLRDDGRETAKVMEDVARSTGALDQAFSDWSNSDAAKTQRALAELQAAAIETGAQLAPIMADIASTVGDVAGAFNALPEPGQRVITTLGGIALIAGPVTSGLGNLAKLAPAVGRGATGLVNLIGVAGKAGPVLGVAAIGVGLLVNEFMAAKREADAAAKATEELAAAASEAGKTASEMFNERLARSWAGFEDGLDIPDIDDSIEQLKEMGFTLEDLSGWVAGDFSFQALAADLDNMARSANVDWDRAKVLDALVAMRAQSQGAVGDQEELEAAQLALAGANAELGVTTDQVTTSTAGLIEQQQESTVQAERQRSAYERAEEALDSLVNTILGAFDSEVAYERAMRDTRDAIDELAEARRNASPAEQQQAYDDALDSIRDQADALVDMKIAQAEANGETLDAEDQNRLYREELLRLAGALGPNEPLRARIIELIGELDEAAKTRDSEINVNIVGDERLYGMDNVLRGLTSRTHRIQALVDILFGDEGPRYLGGGPTGQRWGGIHAFARGGITPAHVARGDLIRYAEPETGGEAFIPRRGDPARSKAILAEAAAWYGMTVVPMASGGITAAASGIAEQLGADLDDVGPVLDRTVVDQANRLVEAADTALAYLEALGGDAVATWSSTMAALRRISDTGSRLVVAAVTANLTGGATEVGTIAGTYTRNLAGAINPVLTAVGKPEVVFRNTGGPIPGPNVNRDVVPAMLTPGEYVLRRDAVDRYGIGFLDDLNTGRLPGFNRGGVVGDLAGMHPTLMARLQAWASALGQTYTVRSGYRSIAEQERLYQAYLAGTGNLAAVPGSSMHNYGLASDGNHWGTRNPGMFGLRYSVPGEPWHVEPIEAKKLRGTTSAHGLIPPVVPDLPATPDHLIGSTGRAAMGWARQAAVDWLGSLAMSAPNLALDPSIAGSGSADQARAWILEALGILGLPVDRWLPGLMKRSYQESSWNPRAINLWDSNAMKGTPSKGFLQTIDPTFNAFRLPGYGDIWNPVHNTIAAVRYMMDRYGGVWNLPAGGYDSGGFLPTGLSLAFNGTGRPEPVGHHLTPADRAFHQVDVQVINQVYVGDKYLGEFVGDRAKAEIAVSNQRRERFERKGSRTHA